MRLGSGDRENGTGPGTCRGIGRQGESAGGTGGHAAGKWDPSLTVTPSDSNELMTAQGSSGCSLVGGAGVRTDVPMQLAHHPQGPLATAPSTSHSPLRSSQH